MKCRSGKWRRGSAGFTLVELMVAMVVMSVIAIGASAFVSNSYIQLVKAKEMNVAANLASSTMEALLNSNSYDLPTNTIVAAGVGNSTYLLVNRGGPQLNQLIWTNSTIAENKIGLQTHIDLQANAATNEYVRPDYVTQLGLNNMPAEVVSMGDIDSNANKASEMVFFIFTRVTLREGTVDARKFNYLDTLVTVMWRRGFFELESKALLEL